MVTNQLSKELTKGRRLALWAFWGSNPKWLSRGREDATRGRQFGESAVPEGECGPCSVFALYLNIRLTAEEESRK
jgi:hypothetical protein